MTESEADDDSDGTSDNVPEYIPESESDSESAGGNFYADIAANITQYTDRPDLLLAETEKHDPGFIKAFNEAARQYSNRNRQERFKFGKIQSYVGLSVSAIAALAVIAALFYLISQEQAGIWSFIGLGIFYAITQGGTGGFSKIIKACEKAIVRVKGHQDNS